MINQSKLNMVGIMALILLHVFDHLRAAGAPEWVSISFWVICMICLMIFFNGAVDTLTKKTKK